eukprot:CAMPEP_0198135384 /NCGR_PEP_ID=MMETSP1442-20131203/60560_1 /TAXON_ID= /ORGANISM="Craspedostauros australis, Strain CCMP3328" /LENGTH=175 /DNA_ID=CAMNT_0043796551 /DNA_START=580 /DNA_END=1106 /DNA_ORIENTATION=+
MPKACAEAALSLLTCMEETKCVKDDKKSLYECMKDDIEAEDACKAAAERVLPLQAFTAQHEDQDSRNESVLRPYLFLVTICDYGNVPFKPSNRVLVCDGASSDTEIGWNSGSARCSTLLRPRTNRRCTSNCKTVENAQSELIWNDSDTRTHRHHATMSTPHRIDHVANSPTRLLP